MNPWKKARAGFTLIELLVVLAILGVLAAAVSFSTDKRPAAVRGATDAVYASITEARGLARSLGQPVAIETSGIGSSLGFDYAQAKYDAAGALTGLEAAGPRGGFTFRGDVANYRRFVQIDDGGNQYAAVAPSPTLISAITDANANNIAIFKYQAPAATWANPLFKSGGASQVRFTFSPDGRPNLPFYVAVVGLQNGVASAKAPVGVVVVDAQGIITRYFKERADDPSKLWKRI